MSTRCSIEFYSAGSWELAARLYKHSDGCPSGIIPLLKRLYNVVSANLPNYGPRCDDPGWVAAEFINQFRVPGNAPQGWFSRTTGKRVTKPGFGSEYRSTGNIYVSQQLHGDIEYLYRIYCGKEWRVDILRPEPADPDGRNRRATDLPTFALATSGNLADMLVSGDSAILRERKTVIKHGAPVTAFRVPSDTVLGREYIIWQNLDTSAWACTCPGYVTRKLPCKHLTREGLA